MPRYNRGMTYTCKVCGVTSDAAEFYAGVNNRCKECHKRAVRENRTANVERYRAYDAKRFQEDPRVLKRHKAYQKTEAGKEAALRARKKWINQKPEARAAHIILGNAVRDGRIEKPKECSECGGFPKRRNLHAHHEDYAFPLSVIWLCAQCHHEKHKDK